MEIIIQKKEFDWEIGITGELCQPKEQRELSGGPPNTILVVILILWIGPHFEHLYFSDLINLLIVNTGEKCRPKGQ